MTIKQLESKLDDAVGDMADDGVDDFDFGGSSLSQQKKLIDDAHNVAHLDNIFKKAKKTGKMSRADFKWVNKLEV